MRNKLVIYSSTGLLLAIPVVILCTFFFGNSLNLKADDYLDRVAYSKCKDAVNRAPIGQPTMKNYLKTKYGKSAAPDDHTTFDVDFDTYKDSWNDYPGGNGQEVLNSLKAIKDQAILNTKTIYGEPFHKNKVVVVYNKYLQDSQLNPDKLENASALYDSTEKMIILGFDNTEPTKELFIHEMVHAFNDGVVPSESYEEGLAESVASVVDSQIENKDNIYSNKQIDTKRNILSSIAGLFRTIDNKNLVLDRYTASAEFFLDQYNQNPKFYINYRQKLAQNAYVKATGTNPKQYFTKVTAESACAELTDNSNRSQLKPMFASMQSVLKSSVADPKKADTLMNNNPIISQWPPSGVYADIQFDQTNKVFNLMGTYKRTNLIDIILALYQKYNGNSEREISLSGKLASFFSGLDSSKFSSIQNLSYLIEEPVDSAIIQIMDTNKKVVLEKKVDGLGNLITSNAVDKKIADSSSKSNPTDKTTVDSNTKVSSDQTQKTVTDPNSKTATGGSSTTVTTQGSGSLGALTQDEIVKALNGSSGNYNGNFSIKIQLNKNIFAGRRTDKCYRWPGGKICYPKGLASDPKTITGYQAVTFNLQDGVIAPVSQLANYTSLKELK